MRPTYKPLSEQRRYWIAKANGLQSQVNRQSERLDARKKLLERALGLLESGPFARQLVTDMVMELRRGGR